MEIPRQSPQIRRRARERALQFLFGLDFTKYEWESVLEGFWEQNPSKPGAKRYGELLIHGVIDNMEELDEVISPALDNWTLERIGAMERSVLRIALYEMLYLEDVPVPVAINEAVEIAKQYGSDDAPRFVNGVLDRLKEVEPRQKST